MSTRDAFEAAVGRMGYGTERHFDTGAYIDRGAAHAWNGWQAAMRARLVVNPVEFDGIKTAQAKAEDVRDAALLRGVSDSWQKWQAAELALCKDESATDAEERAAALYRTAFAIHMHEVSKAVTAMQAATPPAEAGKS